MGTDAQRSMSMYFVRLGVFRYRRLCWLDHKKFFSEQALWVAWYHRGDLICYDDVGELVGVNSQKFGLVLRANPKVWDFALHYAISFVEFMNSMDQSLLTDISNLHPQESDLLEVCRHDPFGTYPNEAWSASTTNGSSLQD